MAPAARDGIRMNIWDPLGVKGEPFDGLTFPNNAHRHTTHLTKRCCLQGCIIFASFSALNTTAFASRLFHDEDSFPWRSLFHSELSRFSQAVERNNPFTTSTHLIQNARATLRLTLHRCRVSLCPHFFAAFKVSPTALTRSLGPVLALSEFFPVPEELWICFTFAFLLPCHSFRQVLALTGVQWCLLCARNPWSAICCPQWSPLPQYLANWNKLCWSRTSYLTETGQTSS